MEQPLYDMNLLLFHNIIWIACQQQAQCMSNLSKLWTVDHRLSSTLKAFWNIPTYLSCGPSTIDCGQIAEGKLPRTI